MEHRKTISTLNYASTAIVAASTGMVLARPESPFCRRHDVSSSSPPVNSRSFSPSPLSSRNSTPLTGTRTSVATPSGNDSSFPTTGWVNSSPQKNPTPPRQRDDTPLSSESVTSPTSPPSSGRKPRKLRRRKSKTPPLFSWRGKSKSPPMDDTPPRPSPPAMVTHEDHYHLYDIGTRNNAIRPINPRHSIVSINSISASIPRTPLRRIYPPPQTKDSPRLISPSALCTNENCSGTPQKEQLLIRTLRRMTSDGSLSPSRSPGHKRNQSVPSFDSITLNSPKKHVQTNGYVYQTPSRSGGTSVWLVNDNTPMDDRVGSQARRKLEFGSQHRQMASNNSTYGYRLSSQSPPPETIPERCDSLSWDSENDPTYESMKTEHVYRKPRISSVFDETDLENVVIPDHKSPRTKVKITSLDPSVDELDWGDSAPTTKSYSNVTRRMPSSFDIQNLRIPPRTTSLSRSKSMPPQKPNPSPDRNPKRLSAPKECWDNDFEDEGSDVWMIPENIADAQDKLKGYLSNIRTFSTLIEDLKKFRQSHPRTDVRPLSQEQLLDEIDAMIEISTLDGFTPPPFSGPPLSPKKSTPSLASSQWSFEDRLNSFAIEDESPTPPSLREVMEPPALDPKDLQARRLLEKILGVSDDFRLEVKPEQLTKMIDYVTDLRNRCDDEFESLDGIKGSWNIGLGVYV